MFYHFHRTEQNYKIARIVFYFRIERIHKIFHKTLANKAFFLDEPNKVRVITIYFLSLLFKLIIDRFFSVVPPPPPFSLPTILLFRVHAVRCLPQTLITRSYEKR